MAQGNVVTPFLDMRSFVREESEVFASEAPAPALESPFVSVYELESPFLDRELFVVEASEELEARAAALAEWSPFQGAILPEREARSDDVSEAEFEEELAYQDQEAEADSANLFEGQAGTSGGDDRDEVTDTTIVPYKWICSVTYEKDGKTLDGGTGFLISDRHVLTAGHVITDARLNGPYPPSLVVYPGRHYGGEPFGTFLAARTRVSPHRNLDYGLITLNKPVDPRVQWWGHPATATDVWTEALLPLRQLRQTALPIRTAGYPGVKDSYRRRMVEAQGQTQPASFGVTFRHTAATTGGQSGSPIWTERGGRLMLIGIATSYDATSQLGLLLHDALVRNQVRRWMAQDAPRPKRVQRRIPLEVPYRWVCRLEVRDNDLKRTVGYGTGVMISNKHVLTSARVIHGFSKDRRRYSIHITPGYEFGKEALGSTTASKGRVSPKFSPDTKDASEDYGLLTLSKPLGAEVFSSIGKIALGSWGDESHGLVKTDADWTGKAAHVAAYSRLSGGGGYHKLRVAKRGTVHLQRGQLLHEASEKLDAPGAPIWVEAGKRRLLAGIATSIFSKDSGVNWGCYLSQATQSQLIEWVNADHADQELPEAGFSAEDFDGDAREGLDTLTSEDQETQEEEEANEEHEEESDEYESGKYEEEGEGTLRSTLDEAEEYAGETSDYSSSEPPFALTEEEEQGAHAAIAKGERDEVKLTNLEFQARHQELPADYKIKPQETALRKEWTEIRDKIIRPALQSATEKLIVEPPFTAYDPGFVPNAALQTCVKGKTPDDWRIALVDLTNPASPAYGGNDKHDKTVFAASLAKVGAMFAAFELKKRVSEALKPVPVTTSLAMVLNALEKVWQPKLDATKPASPAAFKGFPKLTQIFDIRVVAGAWKVDFTSRGSIASLGTNAQAELAPFSKIDGKFGFKELLELMVSFSNDEASARCITMLSYEYIHGALVTAGLYETGKGGLWLGAPYRQAPAGTPGAPERNRIWMAEPTIKATEPNTSRRFQVGSPEAFARMFTLLAKRKLIDPTSSNAMLDLLKTKTSDFIKKALDADGRHLIVDGMRSKIGVIAKSYFSQASFVQRDVIKAGKPVQYVIVILNNTSAPFINNKATIGPLDQCILDL
jgi:V8-like Glu-specific endopeptidase